MPLRVRWLANQGWFKYQTFRSTRNADGLAGIEVEPSALLHVPCDGQRLEPPAWHTDQHLLEGVHPEDVRHLEVRERAVGSVGVHHDTTGARPEQPLQVLADFDRLS